MYHGKTFIRITAKKYINNYFLKKYVILIHLHILLLQLPHLSVP